MASQIDSHGPQYRLRGQDILLQNLIETTNLSNYQIWWLSKFQCGGLIDISTIYFYDILYN